MADDPKQISLQTALLIFLAVSLLTVGVHLWLKWPGTPEGPVLPQELLGPMLQEPKVLEPLSLTDHDGQPFTLENLKGRWSLLFFGYTHCPDVCPTAMGTLAGIFEELGKTPDFLPDTRGVFVSVDPQRDTAELLKGYVTYFNPAFLGVTGTPEAVAAFTRQLGVGYLKQPGGSAESYEISHTTSLFLVDPLGRLVAVFPRPHDPHEIAVKYLTIRQHYGEQG